MMTLFIKNMVCNRCILVIQNDLYIMQGRNKSFNSIPKLRKYVDSPKNTKYEMITDVLFNHICITEDINSTSRFKRNIKYSLLKNMFKIITDNICTVERYN